MTYKEIGKMEFKNQIDDHGKQIRVTSVATMFTSYNEPYEVYKDSRGNYFVQVDDAGRDVELCHGVETDEQAEEYLRGCVEAIDAAQNEDDD